MQEIWKDIIGYEGSYQVSNTGKVKSLDRVIKDAKKEYIKRGNLLKITDNGNGYKIVSLSKKGRKNNYVHRLVATHFISNPDNKPQVNHKDGIKSNNFKYNLEWCSVKENQVHAHKIGLQPIRGNKSNSIKVIDTSNNMIFDCIKDASDFFNIKYNLLKLALNSRAKPKKPLYIRLKKLNKFIEDNPKLAKELGLSVSRLDK